MTYTLRFLPDIEDDAVVAYEWYEEKLAGLGIGNFCKALVELNTFFA